MNQMNSDDKIELHFRLNSFQKTALKKLGLKTILDILYHFPTRYGDISQMQNISSLIAGDDAVIFGKITGLKTSKAYIKKIPMSEGRIEDSTGSIKCIWFHQPYIAKMIGEESFVRAEGKVSERKGVLYLSNPKIEKVTRIPLAVGNTIWNKETEDNGGEKIQKNENPALEPRMYPIYPESKGITSNWLFYAFKKIAGNGLLDRINDPIPKEILQRYSLPSIKTALLWIHSPHNENDAKASQKRFAFEEVFFIQLAKQKEKAEYQKNPTFAITLNEEKTKDFIKRLPFNITDSQKRAITEILTDFERGVPMSRLLEGDVGSGKTAVAAVSAYSVIESRPKGQDYGRLQVAYMCPTEILATQHFESFIKYFSYLNINIALITGSGCKKFPSKINPKGWTDISRNQLLKWVASGEIHILIGTHALIQKTVKFQNLAYVIIDEQHRFGTAQRKALVKKDALGKMRAPHLLSMTATPIPRTLALTIFGDLDLTLLDQMPSGRKSIITEIIPPQKRDEYYEFVRKELEVGRQAYIICPRIDEPDPDKENTLNAKSVIAEAKRLKRDVFREFEIAVLHGKMRPNDKDEVMKNFVDGKVHILCATSVVEVGVNAPNASVIIIEGGERFGLAQLHQLRGRVVRGNHQPYCFVFSESRSKNTALRLHALKTAKNGFELAEYDLQLRGTGDLSGMSQWGVSDIAMEALKNLKMVEAARSEARTLLTTSPDLSKFPEIKKEVEQRMQVELHLE